MNPANKTKAFLCWRNGLFIASIILFSLVLFYPLFIAGQCLFTTDDNLGMMPFIKEVFLAQFGGGWADHVFYGTPGLRGQITWTPLFLGVFPSLFAFNWIHAIDLVLASIFLFFFLRANNISRPAIALGILAAFWLGSNFTLTYAGHISKFSILMLAAAFLVCIKKVRGNVDDWLWCIMAGGLLGLMFIEQQDVALFFGIFLGLYALFNFILVHFPGLFGKQPSSSAGQNERKLVIQIVRVALMLFIIVIMALLVSSTTLISSYAANVQSVSEEKKPDPRDQWEFATQWSWPPEESIDFIAPGYMGWRSGEVEGPYWGGMGRSAGWEKTGQGFMNFKLENQYLGAIPVIFALFAIWAGVIGYGVTECRSKVVQGENNDSETRSCADTPIRSYSTTSTRAEILFWFCAVILALLLSFGKYFPLYQLFYQLPVVNNIRNPNKFLQVFQLAVGILSAYGAHIVFNWNNLWTDRKGLTTEARKHGDKEIA